MTSDELQQLDQAKAERRFMRMAFTPEWLSQLPFALGPNRTYVDVCTNLPALYQTIGAGWSWEIHCIYVILCSPEFAYVPQGQVLPLFEPQFTSMRVKEWV